MLHKNLKTSLLLIGVVILTLGLSISCQSLLAAWTSPTGNPTTCTTGNPGCDEPLNKGSFLQIKSGPLYVNSDQIAATGFAAYGNVGIGTVAPSTNLDVNGSIKSTNLTVFDTTPNVNYGIYANKSFTDPARGTMMQYLWAKPTYTGAETVTENFATSQFLNYPIINTGHTNSGIMYGLVTQVLRNLNGVSADDNGTLTTLRGSYIGYGHYNSNTSAVPQTTNAYGLFIQPYQRTGTTTNMYDLFIANPVTGGDVTNQYGIYQQSASRNNYFAGNVGIGDGTPSYKLDVTGQINATGGLCIAGTCKTAWDTFTNYWTLSGANIYNNNTGNVGIGKTSPSYTLDVNGSIYGKSLYVSTPGGQWLSGKTGTMGINAANAQTTSAYFPVLRQTTSSGHVINLGGLGDNFGFYGYDANRTTNGTDYSFVMNLANGTLTASNNLIVNGNVGIGTTGPSYKLHVVGDIYANGGWLRTSGSAGWYSETYGGGWYMSDSTWIRSYNDKNIWTGAGLLGSNGGLTVGYGGSTPPSGGAIIAGNVGIGTASPASKLSVGGAGNSDFGIYGKGNSGVYGDGFDRGVYGSGNTGVYGSGATYGVYATGNNYGVYSEGNTGFGVYGHGATGVSGSGTSFGVRGSGGAYGVEGYGTTYGVYGNSSSNYGVFGTGGPYGVYGMGNTSGVRGNGGTYGLYGTGTYGVYAIGSNSSGGIGIYGSGDTGVYGGGTTYGIRGFGGPYGVVGNGSSYGVYGVSTSVGVYANGSANDFYGYHGERTVGGAWTNAASYRKWKDNFSSTESYLDKLMGLDMYEWQYKNEVIDGRNRFTDDPYRHASPFLDDFYNTFHLGTIDGYNVQDLAGVTIASVKELNKRFINQSQSTSDEINNLKEKIEFQQKQIEELKAQIEALKNNK